jgi:hypothetical protein
MTGRLSAQPAGRSGTGFCANAVAAAIVASQAAATRSAVLVNAGGMAVLCVQ